MGLKTFGGKLEDSLHKYKVDLCFFCILFGGLLVGVCSVGFLSQPGAVGLPEDIAGFFGGWIYWLAILGFVLLLLGLFYISDYVRKLREFKKLIGISGKSKFIQNQDRIEELAWRLHLKYEKIVIEKKKEMKIR